MAGIGMMLVRSQGMEGSTGNLAEFLISPDYAGLIAWNDPVRLNAGFVEEATGHADNNDVEVLGVFHGVQYVGADGGFHFDRVWDGGAGRSNIRASIALPTGQFFHIKGKAGVVYTQAAIGARYGFDYAPADLMYGISRTALGAAPAATGPLKVVRFIPTATAPGIGDDEPTFEVSLVRQQLTATGTGA